jgi:hypothetical protein
MAESDKQKKQKANFDKLYRKDKPTKEINTANVGPYNRDIQRYDNPFERNNPNQMAADEKIIQDAAQKYNIQDTGAGSDIRNELERMRNKNYQRANPEELKVANSMNLGQNNVGGNQYFTAQQPTFAEVRGDVRTRLGQDARNYGGGIKSAVSAMANAALPGQMFEMANAGLKSLNSLSDQTKNLYSGTVNLFKEGVGALNDVQQQIFMNPEKYKFARNQEEIINAEEKEDEVNRLETLNEKIEADRKRLLDISVFSENFMKSTYPTMREPRGDGFIGAYDKFSNLAKGMLGADNYKTTTEETSDTPEIFRDQFTGTGQSYIDTEDNFNSRIPPGTPTGTANIPGGTPIGTANIPGGTPTGTANAPGGRGNFLDSDAYREMLLDNYRKKEMGTGNMPGGVDDMGLPVQGDITIDVNKDIPYFGTRLTETPLGEFDSEKNIKNLRDNQSGIKSLSEENSITPYNNAFNLEFRNQKGATPGYGGDDGQRFASFKDLDVGLKAGVNRISEIVGDGRSTEGFLNIYAPRSDNKKSFDNYLAELVKRVGPTIEPNEIKELSEGVIKFENKPEIADKYLDYLQKNANKIYGGIISSKNNTMLAEITQADIDRFKQPMTQMMEYETYKDINTDSTLTRDEFNQLKARVA